MSDYVHKKVIRYPLDDIMNRLQVDYPDDCESHLKEEFGGLYGKEYGFNIEVTDENYYLDFVYYNTYGESSGDFGNVRGVTINEFNLISPYISRIIVDVWKYKMRAVEYCYYNCCECTDYYELSENDDDSLEIKKIIDEFNITE